MARCKECMHYAVCAKEGRMVQIDEHTWDNYNQLDGVERFCDNYIATADVAPKSEVERLTIELDAMRGAANSYKMHYEVARQEIEKLKDQNTGVVFKHYFDGGKDAAREIFEEIEKYWIESDTLPDCARLVDLDKIAELKKKYTGGRVIG